MKNSIFVFFTLIFFPQLACMDKSLFDVAPYVLRHCAVKDIVSVLSVNKAYQKVMSSQQGLEVATKKKNEKLFRKLLEQQDEQQQKESYNFLLKMRHFCVRLLDDEDFSEHLLSPLDNKSIQEYMFFYRHEIVDPFVVADIKKALKEYKGEDGRCKDTIINFAHIRSLITNPCLTLSTSPLDFAIECRNKHSVKLLLRATQGKAADYLRQGAPDHSGFLALQEVSNDIITELCKSNLSQYAYDRLLWAAVWHGNMYMLEQVLAKGVDVNRCMADSWTPLHFALHNKRENIVRILLNHPDINVNYADLSNATALHITIEKGYGKDIVQLLLDKGAHIAVQNNKGNTPLHCAFIQAQRHINNSVQFQNLKDIIGIMEQGLESNNFVYSIKNLDSKTIVDLRNELQVTEEEKKRMEEEKTQAHEECEKRCQSDKTTEELINKIVESDQRQSQQKKFFTIIQGLIFAGVVYSIYHFYQQYFVNQSA